MTPQTDYDVLILGGGMVGAALACALGNSPLKVAILDRQKPDLSWPIEGYDLRVSALTTASKKILTHIGAWPGILEKRVSPFTDMTVWDATGIGKIQFHSADIGAPQLGHIVENRVTQGALYDQMESMANVDYIQPAIVTKLKTQDNCASLTLEDGSEINAKLIVGADGARSWLREQLGIQVTVKDYEQKGVVTWVKTENGHTNTARQRFLPTGPLAFLPLCDDYCSIVWSTSTEEADRLVKIDESAFIEELNAALGESELGKVISVSKRAAFPLKKQHAESYCGPRTVLVGDAAHTIHPLAGQGVNLGLLDIATLAEEILTALEKHRDIGSHQVLRKYERRRKGDNTLMMSSMDGFHHLFANDRSALSTIRNFGLQLTNRLPPLKSKIIEHAMGIDRVVPLADERR